MLLFQSLHELRASLQEMLQVPPPPPPLATGYDEDRPHHPESGTSYGFSDKQL
jgi:hypothetical protein